MKRLSRIWIMMLACSFFVPVSFAQKKALSTRDESFLVEFLPRIIEVNKEVQSVRERIIACQKEFHETGKLSHDDEVFLSEISAKYGVNTFKLDMEKNQAALKDEFQDLLKRVDIIPVKLVMAQAICESAWGTSYFAEHANNYFGIHCYSKGCGLPPKGLNNPNFAVKSYPSIAAGIADYIHILNTVSAYASIRSLRAQMREEDQPVLADKLAEGLSRYSQKGEAYVHLIQNLINNYIPEDVEGFLEKNG